MPAPLILAHRGASAAAPENTLVAYELAIEQGADGLEIDVHPTRDGHLVSIHDDSVDRTTDGRGRVTELTLAEIRQLDAGSGFSPDFRGVPVPTLDEVLDLTARHGLVLNIEVKDIYRHDAAYDGAAEATAEAVLARGLAEQVVFSSFNHTSMAELKSRHPELTTGLLMMMPLHEVGAYARTTGADALHPALAALTPALITQAREANLAVNAWTIAPPFSPLPEEEQLRAMWAAGVDAVITNIPDVAVAQRAELA